MPLPFTRRELLGSALAGAAASTVQVTAAKDVAAPPERPWGIVDTNVSLFQWPFRRLPNDTVEELVGKLKSLGIRQAWAGSYEGLLHRDISGVNRRLADACQRQGEGRLLAFGSINPTLPDWEEDLRRCDEQHRMPGIRLHPNYHGYTLDDPRFQRLLTLSAERGLLVQLAVSMEDRRTQHPMLRVDDVDLGPLPGIMQRIPQARLLLLNAKPRGADVDPLLKGSRIALDIARVEATDGIAKLIRAVPEGRVVFGSHAPFFVHEAALIKVYESELEQHEAEGLFEQNASRLLERS